MSRRMDFWRLDAAISSSSWKRPCAFCVGFSAILGVTQPRNHCSDPILPGPCYIWRFFFYSKQKIALKGHRFDCIYDVQVASQKALDMVTDKALQWTFCLLQEHKTWHVDSQGDYFEKFHNEKFSWWVVFAQCEQSWYLLNGPRRRSFCSTRKAHVARYILTHK